MITNEWRNLTSEEILLLQTQHCKAENWNQVKVCPDFCANHLEDVRFSGEVFLGKFGKSLTLSGGVVVESGIYHARIHNCRISDHVYIHRIHRYMANYLVGEGSIIENVDCIYTEGESRFGNGTVVSVLDETGGKPVVMYDGLSAHTAYLMVANTHRPQLMEALKRMAKNRSKSFQSEMGQIGKFCCIRNAGTIRNVNIGNGCEVDGALSLNDGSLCASSSAFSEEKSEPFTSSAFVGHGVIAHHFILAPGAVVKDGAQLVRCFVGEAAELSHGFSAHDSLFFANCQMENGEACASFAGPYTVSMHKSTLLVGGMFSFSNFGSGTNQSNHLYKLGPMHSGVCERGCKTGSDAYILWPGKIGAFTFIKGRHTGNPDTRIFPFSHLLEDGGKSWLIPGANLRSIGTLRDETKWPLRDRRTSLQPWDRICFEALNPDTADCIGQGLDVLEAFVADGQATEYALSGAWIRKSALAKGIKLYRNALQVYMGTALYKKLEQLDAEGCEPKDILSGLLASPHWVSETWSDLSGLLIPDSELSVLLAKLEKDEMESVLELEDFWGTIYRNYESWSWQQVLQLLAKQKCKVVQELQASDFIQLLDEWQDASAGFYKLMLVDGDLELTMMRRFSPGNKIFTHSFTEALQLLLEELPQKVAKAKRRFVY